TMLHRAQRGGRNAQLDLTVERFGDQRDVAEVGQKAAAGPVERVAHIVAGHHALAGEFTAPCHFFIPVNRMPGPRARPPVNRSGLVEENFGRGYRETGAPRQAKARIWLGRVAIARWTGRITTGNLDTSLIRGSADRTSGNISNESFRVTRFSLSSLFAGAALLVALAGTATAQQAGTIASYIVSIGGINVSNIDIRLSTEGAS